MQHLHVSSKLQLQPKPAFRHYLAHAYTKGASAQRDCLGI